MSKEMKDPRKVFGNAVFEMAKNNPEIVVLSSDSGGSSGFAEFKKIFPDRYFEFGIMEQCAMGVSSGLATTGKTPFFAAIAPFTTLRPFEMFRNDLGYMRQNAKIVGRNGGLSYNDLGPTHYSLEDFAVIRMIPNVVILSPQDLNEIKNATYAMAKYKGPVYMRLGSQPTGAIFDDVPFEIGKGNIIRDGNDVTIITTGTITQNVLDAVNILVDKGIDPLVIGMPTINPIDEEIIRYAANKTKKIVTVEEHFINGGMGTVVAEVCSRSIPVPIKTLGVKNEYVSSGPYDDLLSYYGLDKDGIVKSVLDFL